MFIILLWERVALDMCKNWNFWSWKKEKRINKWMNKELRCSKGSICNKVFFQGRERNLQYKVKKKKERKLVWWILLPFALKYVTTSRIFYFEFCGLQRLSTWNYFLLQNSFAWKKQLEYSDHFSKFHSEYESSEWTAGFWEIIRQHWQFNFQRGRFYIATVVACKAQILCLPGCAALPKLLTTAKDVASTATIGKILGR